MVMPDGLKYLTADEVAETFPNITDELYSKLWNFVAQAKRPTPLGGDGWTQQTVETPDGRLDLENDDKLIHWWAILTGSEQQLILKGHHATK